MPQSDGSRTHTVYAAVSDSQRNVVVEEAALRDRPLSMFVFLILRNATKNFTDFSIADQRPESPEHGPLKEREYGR